MDKRELDGHRQALQEKLDDLSRGLRNRQEIQIEKAPDAIDEVQLAAERELAIRNLDRESQLLREVRAARARIEDGTYGICQRCEEEIGQRRLDAVPWAANCIRCQEAIDRERKERESAVQFDVA